jgi:formiminoglutamase
MLAHFKPYASQDQIIKHRKGEVKLGERFKFSNRPDLESLKSHKKRGAKFALIGIPESIGILANQGEAGAECSWEQFILHFANLQSNRFLEGSSILCLGQVETKDLQNRAIELNPADDQYYTKLRSLCQELDQRVTPIIELLARAGLVPIVIGGGHNNAFPILKGMFMGLESTQGISCINCDAHADFRPLEGRHSGNGFSYAFYQGYLHRYFVLGLNENANSEAMLKNMDLEPRVDYDFHQPGLEPEVFRAVKFIQEAEGPVGLEVDLDTMLFMPASAYSASGFTLDQVRVLIKNLTEKVKPVYLHLTEGQIKDQSREAQTIGKTLATLVLDFLKSYPR